MSKTQKNDFIEIEFVGKTKDGEIFDTNIKEEAQKINLEIEDKKLIVCIGHKMLIQGFDDNLEEKEIGKEYTIELKPKQAFGDRRRELVRLIPKQAFIEQKIDPYPGLVLSLDNHLVKIISVSGGRVLVDFNNPLAGKDIIYKFEIKRKVDDLKEKVQAISDFFLRGKFEFEINDKIVFKTESYFKPLIDELNKRFKDILGKEIILEDKK